MESIKVDLRSVFLDVLKNIVIILLSSAAMTLGVHIVIQSVHEPVYTSSFSYVVISNEASVISNKANQNELVKVFQEVLQSNILKNKVEASLGYKDGEHMTSVISTEIAKTVNIDNVEENSNIITVIVTDSTPIKTYQTAKAIMENCGSVSEYINKNATLTLLEKPGVPTEDSKAVNYVKVDLLLFVLFVMLLCFAVAFMSVKRDTIKTSEDVMTKLKARLLSSVPDITFKDKKHKKKARNLLVTDKHTGFYYIENIKKIRSKIELEKNEGGMCIAVSSILPQEGRTTIAANLALSLAMHRNNVLLVDMDFKTHALQKMLNYSEPIVNFTDFLDGDCSLTQAMATVQGMKVLFQEKAVSNSSELINSHNMRVFLEYVQKQFDYVIIDTSPISMSADMEVLSGIIDYSIMVIKQDSAAASAITEAIDMMDRNKCSLIGCVFNRDSKITGNSGYGYYGKYSGYGNYSKYDRSSRKTGRRS